MNRNKAYILCTAANSSPIYQPWLPFVEHVLVEEYSESWQPPADCGIVISHLHYDFPTATILSRITKQNEVPVLVLADGILEYRNTFQNPTVAAGSIFMPVHGHKLACIGDSQARIVSSWGNAGKCEVVGLPRLDTVKKNGDGKDEIERDPSKFRILITTARKPGFDLKQLDLVRKSLNDVKQCFDSTQIVAGKKIELTWRLTGELETYLSVNQDRVKVEGQQIYGALKKVDAVISTPSTVILESWLHGLPTATLDYTNSPTFVPTAWNISSAGQILETVKSLIEKPEPMMLFQNMSMDDSLQHHVSATERMKDLIYEMIKVGNDCRANQTAISFPPSILGTPLVDQGKTEEATRAVSLTDAFSQDSSTLMSRLRVTEAESLATQLDQAARAIQQMYQRLEAYREETVAARHKARIAERHYEFAADQGKWLRGEIQRLQLALRIRDRQTRLERRVCVRSSIAFQKWYFFVTQPERSSKRMEQLFSLDVLFKITPYPKTNKLPATVQNFQKNKKQPPQIKMWKQPPTHALLRKIKRSTTRSQMRVRILRVTRAT